MEPAALMGRHTVVADVEDATPLQPQLVREPRGREQVLQLPIVVEQDLRERDYGSLAGLAYATPRPGYDPVMQAMGGLMSVTGESDATPGGSGR